MGLSSQLDNFNVNEGADTLVNFQTIRAVWSRASPNQVQMYLHESEWGMAAYMIAFPAAVLAAPYSLVNGMRVTWVPVGWNFAVRAIAPIVVANRLVGVTVIAVLESE